MHHDVGAAGLGLVVGQAHGELRVHHGKLGPGNVVVVGALLAGVFIGDDAAVAHLAAGGGDGEHHAHGHVGRRLALVVVELPHILVRLGQTVAYGLGGVDDAAAAHGQEEVHAFLPAQLYALSHLAQVGIGHNAAQLHMRDALRIQSRLYPVDEPGAHCALAAIVYEHLAAAELGY